MFIGKAVQTVTPAVGSVTNDMLAGSIESSKLASGVLPTNKNLFNAYRSGTQTINHNAWSDIQMNAETFDVDSKFNTTNYRYTPASTGYYKLYVNLSVDFNDTNIGRRIGVRILKNGSTVAYNFNRYDEGTGDLDECSINLSWIDNSTSTSDFYVVQAYQNNGAGTNNANIIGGSAYTYFMGYKLIT